MKTFMLALCSLCLVCPAMAQNWVQPRNQTPYGYQGQPVYQTPPAVNYGQQQPCCQPQYQSPYGYQGAPVQQAPKR